MVISGCMWERGLCCNNVGVNSFIIIGKVSIIVVLFSRINCLVNMLLLIDNFCVNKMLKLV